MSTSLIQKIKLILRGWGRRRAADAVARDKAFVAKNVSWGSAPAPAPALAGKAAPARTAGFDHDGLQVAYLDDSGQMEHYLDLETGDVVEFLCSERAGRTEPGDPRYARVPARTAESDADDRRCFLETLEDSNLRAALGRAITTADPATSFRKTLATSRAAERSWYNFKNDRALEAVERWTRQLARRGNHE